jgi:hypothetical protein
VLIPKNEVTITHDHPNMSKATFASNARRNPRKSNLGRIFVVNVCISGAETVAPYTLIYRLRQASYRCPSVHLICIFCAITSPTKPTTKADAHFVRTGRAMMAALYSRRSSMFYDGLKGLGLEVPGGIADMIANSCPDLAEEVSFV